MIPHEIGSVSRICNVTMCIYPIYGRDYDVYQCKGLGMMGRCIVCMRWGCTGDESGDVCRWHCFNGRPEKNQKLVIKFWRLYESRKLEVNVDKIKGMKRGMSTSLNGEDLEEVGAEMSHRVDAAKVLGRKSLKSSFGIYVLFT